MKAQKPAIFSLAFFLLGALYGQTAKDVKKVAKQGASAIPELQRFLLNPDVKVRLEAVKAIVDIGGPRTLAPLIEAAGDNDAEVQIRATTGLVNFSLPGYVRTGLTAPIRKFSSDIRSRFYDPDDQTIDAYIVVRADVTQAIGRVARSGSSLDSRAAAARALGILRAKPAVPDLIEALRSRDSDVILEALVALEKIRESSACDGIRFLVRDFDERVQTEALNANGVLACHAALPDIRQVLSRTDKDKVRRAALTALAMMPERGDHDTFSQYLGSDDERMRAAAAEGFARLASINDAPLLQSAFDKETRNTVRLALAFALVMDGNLNMAESAPLRYLIYSLNNNNYRTNAAAYLTEAARNPEVRRALYQELQDGTRDEKIYLARAIAASGDKSSVEHLQKLTQDPDAQVAQEGVRQLRNLQTRL